MAQSIRNHSQSNRPIPADFQVPSKRIRLTSPQSLANLCIDAFPQLKAMDVKSSALYEKKTATVTWCDAKKYRGIGARYGELKNEQDQIIAFVKYNIPNALILKQTDKTFKEASQDRIQQHLKKLQLLHKAEKTFLMDYSTQYDFIINEKSKDVLANYTLQEIDLNDPKPSLTLIPELMANDLIILEFGDLNLYTKITTTSLSMQELLNHTHTFLTWVDTLEKNYICHNDIKLENILYFGDQLKLIDWGSVVFLQPNGQLILQQPQQGNIGTFELCSPEIVYFIATDSTAKISFNKKDIWSVGIIMFAMLFKRKLIPLSRMHQIYLRAKDQHSKTHQGTDRSSHIRSKIKTKIQREINTLFDQLKQDLENQIYLQEEKQIKLKYFSLIEQILEVSLNRRLTANQALSFFKTQIQPLQAKLSPSVLNSRI